MRNVKYPPITAIMVTLGRGDMVAESYRCFQKQTYPDKKLLIVTDCVDDSYEMLKDLARHDKSVTVLHTGVEKKTLGELRNVGLDYATDLSIQWDDDDWYAPNRIMLQWEKMAENPEAKAVMLTEQLHYFRDTGQVGWTVDSRGIEGTILFDKNCGLKYPSSRRGEDTVLKQDLIRRNMLVLANGGICYCRTYHGSNTWERDHHVRRIRSLGKTQKQMDMSKMREAAELYGWRKDWTPIYGRSVTVL